MGGYQRERDEHALPMYEFTCQLATMEPSLSRLFGERVPDSKRQRGRVRVRNV